MSANTRLQTWALSRVWRAGAVSLPRGGCGGGGCTLELRVRPVVPRGLGGSVASGGDEGVLGDGLGLRHSDPHCSRGRGLSAIGGRRGGQLHVGTSCLILYIWTFCWGRSGLLEGPGNALAHAKPSKHAGVACIVRATWKGGWWGSSPQQGGPGRGHGGLWGGGHGAAAAALALVGRDGGGPRVGDGHRRGGERRGGAGGGDGGGRLRPRQGLPVAQSGSGSADSLMLLHPPSPRGGQWHDVGDFSPPLRVIQIGRVTQFGLSTFSWREFHHGCSA